MDCRYLEVDPAKRHRQPAKGPSRLSIDRSRSAFAPVPAGIEVLATVVPVAVDWGAGGADSLAADGVAVHFEWPANCPFGPADRQVGSWQSAISGRMTEPSATPLTHRRGSPLRCTRASDRARRATRLAAADCRLGAGRTVGSRLAQNRCSDRSTIGGRTSVPSHGVPRVGNPRILPGNSGYRHRIPDISACPDRSGRSGRSMSAPRQLSCASY